MKKKSTILKRLVDIAFVLEIILAGFLVLGVLIGMKDIFSYIVDIFKTDAVDTYDVFRDFLAYVLLLVVGIELILMLVSHSVDSIIEFILFVIARKMLIYAGTMTDLLLGTVSISILFLTIKFFSPKGNLIKSDD